MVAQHEKAESSRRTQPLSGNARSVNRAVQCPDWHPADAEGTLRATKTVDPAQFYLVRRRLLVDLANLRDDGAIEWFWGKWHEHVMSEAAEDLLELRDELQTIWRWTEITEYPDLGFSSSGPIKFIYKWRSRVYHDDLSPNQILERWLVWRPSVERLKAWQREGWIDARFRNTFGYLPFGCSLTARQLIAHNGALRAMLIVGVFDHWGHFKYCANPNCVTPYFIAKRKDQTVCDAEICKAEKQREHARRWWNENRAKKTRKPAKVASKPPKKGRGKNVTRKTR
jgi:hypothetical protein